MGMGSNQKDLETSPFMSSSGPQSSTMDMAGQQPIEPRESRVATREPAEEGMGRKESRTDEAVGAGTTGAVPEVVQESQKAAGFDPEASASPQALQVKDELESEIAQKVPEAPAVAEGTSTGEGAAAPQSESSNKGIMGMAAGGLATAGAAAAGYGLMANNKAKESTGTDAMSYLPKSVQDSITSMNSKGTTAPTHAPAEKSLVDHAPVDDASIPQQTHAGDGIEVPKSGATEAEGTTALGAGGLSSMASGGSQVPEEVTHSQQEAGVDPEAAAVPEAVQEKSAVEQELLSKVHTNNDKGEPAPTASSSGVSGTMMSGAEKVGLGGAAAGIGAAAMGAAGYASHKSHEPTTAASSVPEPVVESQKEAGVGPEAAAVPEAVQEKSAVESELLQKIPTSIATGEPAPEVAQASALTETAPTMSSTSGPMGGVPSAAGLGAAGSASDPYNTGVAPQLSDPTAGVAASSLDDKADKGYSEGGLNAPASAAAVPPTQKSDSLAPPVQEEQPESRDELDPR